MHKPINAALSINRSYELPDCYFVSLRLFQCF